MLIVGKYLLCNMTAQNEVKPFYHSSNGDMEEDRVSAARFAFPSFNFITEISQSTAGRWASNAGLNHLNGNDRFCSVFAANLSLDYVSKHKTQNLSGHTGDTGLVANCWASLLPICWHVCWRTICYWVFVLSLVSY